MISQDTFIVGKSKFPQCSEPKCFYAAGRHGECKSHCMHVDIRSIDNDNLVYQCDYCGDFSQNFTEPGEAIWLKLIPESAETIKATRSLDA